MANKYRYIARLGTNVREVLPKNNKDAEFDYTENTNDRRFSYDEDFNSDLIFDNSDGDFDFFYGLETSGNRCRKISLEISQYCGADYVAFKTLAIRLIDGEFDLDNCVLKIKPVVVNDYTEWEAMAEVEKNFLEFPLTRVTVNYVRGTFEKVQYDGTQYADRDDPAHFGGAVPSSIGYAPYKIIRHTQVLPPTFTFYYGREVITIPNTDDPGPGWIMVNDLGATKKWARQPLLLFDYENTNDNPAFGDGYILNYVMFGEGEGNGDFDNGILLNDLLTYIISGIGLRVISNFLYLNADHPFEVTYPGFTPNLTNMLVLYQKSDAKRPDDDNDIAAGFATIANFTAKKLIVNICNMFNLKWYIRDGIFRMEHVSWFERTPTIDITAYPFNKFMTRKRKYKYLTNNLPRKEEFQFMEAENKDFVGYPIVYVGDCVNDDVQSVTQIDSFTTDIEFCLSHADSEDNKVSDEGFAVIAARLDPADQKLYTITLPSILEAKPRVNASLSWAFLHKEYFRHDRLQANGFLNNIFQNFLSVRPFKTRDVVIPFCCNDSIDLSGIVITDMGEAQVASAGFVMYQDKMKMTLLYPDLIANVACIQPMEFKYDHFDPADHAFFFSTKFFAAGPFHTQVEATRPDGLIVTKDIDADTEGVFPLTFEPYMPGKWKFRKKIICDVDFSSDYSELITVDTSTGPQFLCNVPHGTFLRQGASTSIFIFRMDDIDIPTQVQVTRPGNPNPYFIAGTNLTIRTDRSFDINGVPPYQPGGSAAPGTYIFRFRRVCDAANGIYSDLSDPVNVTI